MPEIPFKAAHSGNFRPGRTLPVQYIVLHYTANRGDTAKNNADYFARAFLQTSAHYFVDACEVWQSVREEDTAYHCGRADGTYRHPGCRNANSIGVEMCDAVGGVKEAVRANAAALVRELMARYGIPEDHVLRHYDVTGKNCPAPWVEDEAEWAAFKALLTKEDTEMTQEQFQTWFDAAMADYEAGQAARSAADWAAEAWKKAAASGVFDGTKPAAPLSREQAALVLDRLGLLEK